MNNIQELIEQQKAWLSICQKASELQPYELWHQERAELAKVTITVLESMQAPLPEDVADAVSVLRTEYDPHWIADMLERLARHNAIQSETLQLSLKNESDLEQRIEELERQPCSACPYMDEIPPAPAQVIEDLQNRIEKLEGFERIVKMSGQNAGLRLMNAEEENKRLEAALAELQNHVWVDIGDQKFFNRVYDKARAGE